MEHLPVEVVVGITFTCAGVIFSCGIALNRLVVLERDVKAMKHTMAWLTKSVTAILVKHNIKLPDMDEE